MQRASWIRPSYVVIAMLVLAVSSWVGMVAPAEASCWECKYKFIDGGQWFDDIYFEYCGLHEGPGAWDCYMNGDSCIEFGNCEDFITV